MMSDRELMQQALELLGGDYPPGGLGAYLQQVARLRASLKHRLSEPAAPAGQPEPLAWTRCVFPGEPPEGYAGWVNFMLAPVKKDVFVRAATKDDWARPATPQPAEPAAHSKSVMKRLAVQQEPAAAPQSGPTFTAWFLSLSEERRKVLRDDKWALVHAAFDAGLAASQATEQPKCAYCDGKGWAEDGDPEIGSASIDCDRCGGTGSADTDQPADRAQRDERDAQNIADQIVSELHSLENAAINYGSSPAGFNDTANERYGYLAFTKTKIRDLVAMLVHLTDSTRETVLPPLPEPDLLQEDHSIGGVLVEGYSADQMHEYALAALQRKGD